MNPVSSGALQFSILCCFQNTRKRGEALLECKGSGSGFHFIHGNKEVDEAL